MPDAKTKAAALLADALGIPAEAIGPETRIGACPQWDSMAHMRLILEVEKFLGHALSARAILEISSFEDVVVRLGQTGQGSSEAAPTLGWGATTGD